MGRFRTGLLAAFLGFAAVAALGATYTYSRKEAAETISGAWNYIALVTLGAGANASGGGGGGALTVSSGSAIGFEGQSGDTYQKRDADTGSLDTYKDGILATRIKGNEWTPPVCADANGPVNGGSLCYYNGRLLFRDGAGVHALVGEVP